MDVDSAEPKPTGEEEEKVATDEKQKQKVEEKEQLEGNDDDEEEGTEGEEREEEEEKEVKLEMQKEKGKEKPSGPVKLGYKTFGSSLEMFEYFYKFLHKWGTDINVNKYEHTMLLELLKYGHPDPDEKIDGGIRSFQIRKHPKWQNRCFFLIREDGSVDDFSFRKCVDHILRLPEEMKVKSGANRALGKCCSGNHSKQGGRSQGGSS